MTAVAVAPIIPPSGLGEEARLYLESLGLTASVPCIHSSDPKYLAMPYRYYLERRLGIAPAFNPDADYFSHGHWFHKRSELLNAPVPAVEQHMAKEFKAWTAEAVSAALSLGMSESALQTFVATERVRMHEAWAWYEAVAHLPCEGLPGGISTIYNEREYKRLAVELTVLYKHPNFTRTRFCVRLDALTYHIPTNTLLIDDYKTSGGACKLRAKSCPVEYGTRLYLRTVQGVLGEILRKYSLPADCRLEGMRHIIVAKPPISFGMNDRTFRWTSTGIRSGMTGCAKQEADSKWSVYVGPISGNLLLAGGGYNEEDALSLLHTRTGKKPEKEYAGEPDIKLYRGRVSDWYRGRGDYVANVVAFTTDPPVLVSTTPLSDVMNADAEREFMDLTHEVYNLAVRPADPNRFPRTAPGMYGQNSNQPSPFADFHILPPQAWPQIMRDKLLVVKPRDQVAWSTCDTGLPE